MRAASVTRLHLSLVLALGVVGCDSPTAPSGPDTEIVAEFRADGMLFTAQARVAEAGTVEVSLTVMNETDSFGQTGILGGNCMLRPRLYDPEDGRLVWSAFDLHDACQEPLRVFQLEGGEEATIAQSFSVGAGAGEYRVTLTIDHAATLVELAAGLVSL